MAIVKFELATVCVKVRALQDSNGIDQVYLRVRDQNMNPGQFTEFDLSMVHEVRHVGTYLEILTEDDCSDWSSSFTLDLAICYGTTSAFTVTRVGGGIGIADIRDALAPNFLFDLSDCPVKLEKKTIGGYLFVGASIETEYSNPSYNSVPRPNLGFDYFIRNAAEC